MIVELTEDYVPITVAVAFEMHREGRYKDVPFEPLVFENYLRIMLRSEDFKGFVYVADDGGVAGILLGYISPFEFSPMKRSTDLGFFVVPPYRGTPAAFRLERAYSDWAKARGVLQNHIYLSCSNGYDKAEQFFEKVGYVRIGASFAKGEKT